MGGTLSTSCGELFAVGCKNRLTARFPAALWRAKMLACWRDGAGCSTGRRERSATSEAFSSFDNFAERDRVMLISFVFWPSSALHCQHRFRLIARAVKFAF